MGKKVLVILAEGFEEIEAVTVIDVLRRSGIQVEVVALGGLDIYGSHLIRITVNKSLINADLDEFGTVVLPGGMPGSKHLRDSEEVMDVIKAIYNKGGIVAAICAAPIALAKSGIVDGKKITAYPGVEGLLGKAEYTGNFTEVDGRIITAIGPGASFEFSRLIAEANGMGDKVKETFKFMFVNPPADEL